MPIPQLKKIHQQSWRDTSRVRRPRRGGGRRFSRQTTANIMYLGLIGIMAAVLFSFGYVLFISRDLPDPNRLIDREVAESTKIYDRTGETILYDIHGLEQRTIVNIDELPEYVKWATITAEDRTFYEHHGFNIWGILRGVLLDPFRKGYATGGSTLTQQLVKNAVLTNERSISRKLKEFILSYRIENKFSKDEILQLYFNEIPYGSTAYGIEAGARRYFGVAAKDLTLGQAAILAALPQRPSYLSPYSSHVDELFSRQEWILNGMAEFGYITDEEKDAAVAEGIDFKEPTTTIIAPHFVMYVRELLSERYGDSVIEREGLKIYTTLDLYKQNIAEEVVGEQGAKNAKNYNASNAALVSIDPKNGQIMAMVGSRDYFNDDIDGQVNVAVRPRQPGSSLKPLVYATVFARGYTPNTILYDVVTNFAVAGAKPYEPHNYDLKERGPVSIRTALAGSLNIPAVKALYLTGVSAVTDQAQKMGYTTLNDPDRYGLSLVLGGGEVKLVEHTAAYGVFAREGEYHPPVAILRIEDRNGNIITEYEDDRREVIDRQVARQINDILSDNAARAYAFGANNWLTLPNRPVAAKTGTTNDYHDAWTIGYTPSIVTGVWGGNNDNSEMARGAGGSKVAAPIWNEYMRRVLGNTPVEQFTKPDPVKTGKPVLDGENAGQVTVKIDSVSGLLASEDTPPELIIEKKFQQPHSILHYVNPADPLGPAPEEGEYDVQHPIWEEAIKKWAEREEIELDEVPTEYDNVHGDDNKPSLTIISPPNNSVTTNTTLAVGISVSSPHNINRVEYYIDSHLIDMVTSYPYDLTAQVGYLTNGGHTLRVRACDKAENCAEQSQQINIVFTDDERDKSLSFAWVSPSSGTVSADAFPLQLKTLSYQPQGIRSITFYALKLGQGGLQAITSVGSIPGNEIIATWDEAPEPGIYQVFAEALGTSGIRRKTDVARITVVE